VHTCPEAGPYQLPSCPRAAAPIISALHCEHASTALAWGCSAVIKALNKPPLEQNDESELSCRVPFKPSGWVRSAHL